MFDPFAAAGFAASAESAAVASGGTADAVDVAALASAAVAAAASFVVAAPAPGIAAVVSVQSGYRDTGIATHSTCLRWPQFRFRSTRSSPSRLV